MTPKVDATQGTFRCLSEDVAKNPRAWVDQVLEQKIRNPGPYALEMARRLKEPADPTMGSR